MGSGARGNYCMTPVSLFIFLNAVSDFFCRSGLRLLKSSPHEQTFWSQGNFSYKQSMCLKLSLKLGRYPNLATSKLNLKHKGCSYEKISGDLKFSPQSELSNKHSPDRRKKSDAAFKILNTSPSKTQKMEEK